MTTDNPSKTSTSSGSGSRTRVGPSRRSFLGTVAAVGSLGGISTGVGGTQDGDGALQIVSDFEPPSLPENIAIDDDGTVYLSMAPAGQVVAVDSDGNQSSVATIDVGQGLLLGITVLGGVLYVANGSGQPETHGVWRVEPDGSGDPERIASLPAQESMPNGIIPDPSLEDALLVSDHLGGAIWRVTTDGDAEPWVSDSLLEPNTEAQTPVGADGLAVHPDGDVYVDNLNAGSVMRVPVADDGSAGQVEQIVQDEGLVGADGMTIDEEGTPYIAVNARNEVVRITDDQQLETVVSGAPLDFPADVHFGTTGSTATLLYIANFAYGTFLQDEEAAEPSLARIDVGVRGYFHTVTGHDGNGGAGHDDDDGGVGHDDDDGGARHDDDGGAGHDGNGGAGHDDDGA
ncbi:SMP-30/gluconolactonase/LRE family protein [Natrinema gelatinilyticum]|uniref:SMP-30/gluconolactonase/LRE family protein n=1 Tax=Natrinema gelatinilyticum TaxID=2961571 RepID=UPI0020C1F42D|nr:SMP-30/gluconolactonase/LRE family protein [Natrinema gelatinilyticum]